MRAEGFILEKLQHGRNQRFRYTVDLIDKKNALFTAGLFNLFVDRSDDLTHRIFRYRIFFSLEVLFHDDRESDGTLTGMVSDRIRDKTNATFTGGLFHDCSLSDTRRPDQKNRTLTDSRHEIAPLSVFSCINLYCMKKFLFCFFDIHKKL